MHWFLACGLTPIVACFAIPHLSLSFSLIFIYSLTTILYFNLRISKEGMNQQVLSRELLPKDYQGVSLLDCDDEATGYDNMHSAAAIAKNEELL